MTNHEIIPVRYRGRRRKPRNGAVAAAGALTLLAATLTTPLIAWPVWATLAPPRHPAPARLTREAHNAIRHPVRGLFGLGPLFAWGALRLALDGRRELEAASAGQRGGGVV